MVGELACLNDAVNYAGSSKTGRTGYSPGGGGRGNLVPRAFPLKNGRGGKSPGDEVGGGVLTYKSDGVLVGKFREHLQKVPESCFMGVSQIYFHPQEAVFLHTINIECSITILYFTRRLHTEKDLAFVLKHP